MTRTRERAFYLTVIAGLVLASAWFGQAAGPAVAVIPGENGLVAFARYRDGMYTITPRGKLRRRGRKAQELIDLLGIGGSPARSPDGTKIAFARDMGSRPFDRNDELFVMDADGGNATRLTNNAAGDAQPALSPDGTKLTFVRTVRGTRSSLGKSSIYTMNATGAKQTRRTSGPPDVSPDCQARP